ncbi:MAG: protein-tyrosine-phosphatase [Alphaproteobacteria bacterium]|nr:MAG: protein-tyrosine-phosphatase [Alphaproteobacteria bacterium]
MTMIRNLLAAAFTLFAVACASAPPAVAQSRGGDAQWDNVERIVVIGDLEGAYEKYLDMLRTAALIDADGDWSGGAAHLVQLGDIPDRGPNSRAIMEHLRRLEPQARRAGGRVHALIGNHEAMNIEGDLRYVHPGEYAVFADRGSRRLQDAYYDRYVAALRRNPPEGGMPVIDDAFRAQWETEHPLGFVEHRQAWAPNGELGRWVVGHDSVIRINDILFLHAGLGPTFSNVGRETMNDAIRSALNGRPNAQYPDIVTHQEGPLWYRGLSLNAEDAEQANLEAVLAYHGASRVIVGHTKRASTVLPRFDGRVIITDIAVPSGFADPHAFLIIENGQLITVYRGNRVPLRAGTTEERCSYFEAIAAFDAPDSPNARLATRCRTPTATPETVSPDSAQ